MSKLVGLHLWHRKLTVAHADCIHRLLLGVLVENKHTQIISHTLQRLQYIAQKGALWRCIYTVIHTLAAEKMLARRRLNLQCEVKNGQVFLAVLLIWLQNPRHPHLPPLLLPSPCGYISSCVMESAVTYISDSLHIHHWFTVPRASC